MANNEEQGGFIEDKSKELLPIAPESAKTETAIPAPPPSPKELELEAVTNELLALGEEIGKFAHEMGVEELAKVETLNNRMEYRLHELVLDTQIEEKRIKLAIMREVFEVFKSYAPKPVKSSWLKKKINPKKGK